MTTAKSNHGTKRSAHLYIASDVRGRRFALHQTKEPPRSLEPWPGCAPWTRASVFRWTERQAFAPDTTPKG